MLQVPNVTLNNGVEMPILGFGVFQIPADETEQAVTDALAAGYRHLDTAASYGNEESRRRAIAASGIAREELFVTTKLWIQDAGEEDTTKAFDASLQRLGLDYLDLYLIHQPSATTTANGGPCSALNEQGAVRAIGVSNFHPDRLVDLIDHNEITPAVNQIETHPFHQRAADQELMRERGVQLESWGAVRRGPQQPVHRPRSSPRSALATASRSPRSSCVGSSSATSSSSPSPCRPSGWRRTSTSSTSPSPTTRWPGSPPWTPATSLFFDHRDPAMVSAIGNRPIHD